MDFANFLNESSNVNAFNDFQQQKQQEFQNLVDQQREQGISLVVPLGVEFLRKAGGIIQTGQKIYQNVQNIAKTANQGAEVASDVVSNISNVGDRVAQNLREGSLNTDPEESIPDTESMGLVDRISSVLRGNTNTVSSSTSNALDSAASAVSEGVDSAVSTAAKAASSAAGGIFEGVSTSVGDLFSGALELGGLGYGIYDIIKSFESPSLPTVESMAAPSLELGV